MLRVGLVGVGTMGSRMAKAMVGDPFILTVLDKDRELAKRVAIECSANFLEDLSQLASDVDIVLMSLPGPGDVAEVVSGLLEEESNLTVIVDLSTVDPGSSRARAAEARAHGIEYLDAPVLGRPIRCGQWTLPVGGSISALEFAQPALDRLAAKVVHVGDIGSGNVLKLLNNLMFGAINAITVESMEVARRLGVDLELYVGTIANSGAATVSSLFREVAGKIIAGDTKPDFTLDLLQKDNLLALDMARAVHVPMLVGSAVSCLNALGQDQGGGRLDTSALIEIFTRAEV